ncbi:MAG: hypothetical protein PWQ28_307 [Candidatus Woesearchaeota archaeon]|nr:hypothetical protein [Candidatus Woesearchaeota archaeon]
MFILFSSFMAEFNVSTEKLFIEDPYLKETDVKVVKIEENKVWLDKTIFYALSGGQASDSGSINDIALIDVQKDGESIVHILSDAPDFKEGDVVHLKLDWDKRYSLMKLHSATHIVYFLFKEKTGITELIGSNISVDKARLDYSYPQSIKPLLEDIEREANALIEKGIEIKSYPDEENPKKRWWQLDSIEEWKMPCGGTHVKNTKEIGKIMLKRKNIGSGKERIEIALKLL